MTSEPIEILDQRPIEVLDQGEVLRFNFEDLLKYHGPDSPGGVAHAFQVLRRALPALSSGQPIDRRTLTIDTAFGGPGGRDGFELTTRAVTEGRFTIDPALARSERGTTLERYVFVLATPAATVTATIRPGFVTDEFIALARTSDRTDDQNAHLVGLKLDMTRRLLAVPAEQVYDLE